MKAYISYVNPQEPQLYHGSRQFDYNTEILAFVDNRPRAGAIWPLGPGLHSLLHHGDNVRFYTDANRDRLSFGVKRGSEC